MVDSARTSALTRPEHWTGARLGPHLTQRDRHPQGARCALVMTYIGFRLLPPPTTSMPYGTLIARAVGDLPPPEKSLAKTGRFARSGTNCYRKPPFGECGKVAADPGINRKSYLRHCRKIFQHLKAGLIGKNSSIMRSVGKSTHRSGQECATTTTTGHRNDRKKQIEIQIAG